MDQQVPLLEVSGSLTDLGEAIGSTFRIRIQKRVNDLKESVLHYSDYLVELAPFIKYAQEFFPEFTEEIEVISGSAKVDFRDLMLLNTHEVYQRARSVSSQALRCTSAVSFNSEGAIVGHNEDWLTREQDDLYVLKANIKGQRFISLNYCTELPGVAASLNQAGLSLCVDDLNLKIQPGVPRNFLAHALLGCQDLTQVLKLMNKTTQASGYNYLLTKNNQVWDIEMAPNLVHIEKMANCCYAHTNHCLNPQTRNFEKMKPESSIKRLQKAKDFLKKPMSELEMIKLLESATAENFHPSGEVKTLAMVLIFPERGEFKVRLAESGNQAFSSFSL